MQNTPAQHCVTTSKGNKEKANIRARIELQGLPNTLHVQSLLAVSGLCAVLDILKGWQAQNI